MGAHKFAALDQDSNICGFGDSPASAVADGLLFDDRREYVAVPCSGPAFEEGNSRGSQDLTFDLSGQVVTLEENGGLWFHELEAAGRSEVAE